MSEKLKVGDLVQLLSGGPVMTVAVEEDACGMVLCCWFASQLAMPSDAFFRPAVLRRAGVVLQGPPQEWKTKGQLEPAGQDWGGTIKPVGELKIGLKTADDVKAIIDSVTAKFRQFKLPDPVKEAGPIESVQMEPPPETVAEFKKNVEAASCLTRSGLREAYERMVRAEQACSLPLPPPLCQPVKEPPPPRGGFF